MTDRELVERFRAGDESAFNELVHRHKEKIYGTAHRFTGDHDETDDVVQDVLWKMYKGLKRFRSDAQVGTWVYRITVNTALNALRKKRIREFVPFDELFGSDETESARPDRMLEQQEQRRLIEEAVAALPRKQKAVFILRYHEDLPYEEIARILETTVGGLKANFFHAMRKIEEHVRKAHAAR